MLKKASSSQIKKKWKQEWLFFGKYVHQDKTALSYITRLKLYKKISWT